MFSFLLKELNFTMLTDGVLSISSLVKLWSFFRGFTYFMLIRVGVSCCISYTVVSY